MNEKQTHLDWGFGLKWMVACAVGTVVLGIAAYGSMWWAGEAVTEISSDMLGTMVAGFLFGALFALGGTLGPGLLLRSRGISAERWIGFSVLVTALTMSVGVALMSALFELVPNIVSALFLGVVFGLPMGLVQAFLLRQQSIPAALWPLITVTGYVLSFAIMIFFGGEGGEWIIGVMGLVVGVVTGLGMMWLTRQETSAVNSTPASI